MPQEWRPRNWTPLIRGSLTLNCPGLRIPKPLLFDLFGGIVEEEEEEEKDGGDITSTDYHQWCYRIIIGRIVIPGDVICYGSNVEDNLEILGCYV